MKKNQKIWTVESYLSGTIFATFSSKAKALDSIILWRRGVNSYKILKDLKKINVCDGTPDTVGIEYYDGSRMTLYINYHELNNGAGIIHAYHHEEKQEFTK